MPSTEPPTVDVLDHEPWPVATTPDAALARVHSRARQIRLRRRVPAGVSALAAIGLIAAVVAPGSSTQSLDVGPADDHQVEVDREVEHDGNSVGVSAGVSVTDDRRLPEGDARVTSDGDRANPIVGGAHVFVNDGAGVPAVSRFLLVTDPEGDAKGTGACTSVDHRCVAGVDEEWQHSEPSGDVLALHAELDQDVAQLGLRMEYLDLSSDIRDNSSHRDGNVRSLRYRSIFRVDEIDGPVKTDVWMEVERNLETDELRGSLVARRWCTTMEAGSGDSCDSSRHDLRFTFDEIANTISVSAALDQINAALSEVTEARLGRGSVLRDLRTGVARCGIYPDDAQCVSTGLDITSYVESYTLEPGGN